MHKIVHWFLITMIVAMPLRSVMALDQSLCQDQDQPAQQPPALTMHHAHRMMHAEGDDAVAANDCCCCDADKSCHSDCGISLSVNVIMPRAITVTAVDTTSLRVQLETNLILRESSPPIRPPRYL